MKPTSEELARYHRNGFVGPYRGWGEDDIGRIVDRLLPRLERLGLLDDERQGLNCHTEIPEVAKLATDPEIVDRFASILGPNLLLFETHVGVITSARPGPAWHRHIYPDWEPQPSIHCVARIALTAEPEGHCHKFIPASAVPADTNSAAEMGHHARPETATSVPLRPGEFALFDGALLHCAADREDGREPVDRVALVVRVATPAQRLGTFADTGQCFVLRGRDEQRLNRCSPLAHTGPATDDAVSRSRS